MCPRMYFKALQYNAKLPVRIVMSVEQFQYRVAVHVIRNWQTSDVK